LFGGSGQDTLDGASGRDTFTGGTELDLYNDFDPLEDTKTEEP
jgi:Ca2+-binding RTX toxin-like protein